MSDDKPGLLDAERLLATVDDLITGLTALDEATFSRRPAADAWTAAEVVGHVTEMMPYWARAGRAIAASPGASFGRAEDDPDRVGAVRAANDRARAEALTRLRAAAHEAADIIATFDTAGWNAVGTNPGRGSRSVQWVITNLLVDHAVGHARQALQAAGGLVGE